MKRHIVLAAAIIPLLLTSASAQLGFGAGLGIAALGSNIEQASGELSDLFSKDSITYGDVSGNIGFYGTGRVRVKMDPIWIMGDVSYLYFQASEIQLRDFSNNSATFEVGTSMVPVNVSATFAIPAPVVHPYVGVGAGATFISRTYTFTGVDGSGSGPNWDVYNRSESEPEYGAQVHAGVEFDLGGMTLDTRLQYNMTNLFSSGDNEDGLGYLQLGAALMFEGGK